MKKDVLVFDSETTGLPPKGAKYDTDFASFPHVVQLSWFLNGNFQDYIIKPEGWEIPIEATAIHGISTERALEYGTPFNFVANHFIHDCLIAKKIVGHNIYFDSSIIKANILRLEIPEFYTVHVEPALDKDKRICTMMKTIKFVNAKFANGNGGKFPKLEELYFHLFKEDFPAHNSLEDVKATLRCADKLVELGIIEI